MEGQAHFSDNQQAERRNYWCPMFGTQYQGIRKGHGDTISPIILPRSTEAKTVLPKKCGLNLLKIQSSEHRLDFYFYFFFFDLEIIRVSKL